MTTSTNFSLASSTSSSGSIVTTKTIPKGK